MLLQHGKSISGAIGTLISILSPIIWGMVITYLLWPLVKMFQRKLFEPLLQKIRPKKPVSKSLARGLSVVLARSPFCTVHLSTSESVKGMVLRLSKTKRSQYKLEVVI